MPEPHAIAAEKVVEALIAERKRLGWSQETLAVAADVSSSCIRHLEHRRSSPTLITVLKLSEALGLDLAEVLVRTRVGKVGKQSIQIPARD